MGTYARLLRVARRHARLIALATAFLLAATAADLWLILLFRSFVDRGAASSFAAPATLGIAATALAAAFARGASAYLGARLAARASTALVADLQETLYGHLHGLSLEFFHRSRPGDLAARLFHDVEGAARLVTGVTPAALEAPVRLAAMFSALSLLHAPMAAIAAAVLVPAVILERWLGRALRERFRDLFDHVAALYEVAQESLAAAEPVKVFAREREETDAFSTRTRARVRKENALFDLQAAEEPVGQVLRLAALIGVVAYGAHDVAAGRLSPGDLAAALLAAHAFLGALQSVAGLYSGAQAGLASAERVFSILDERPSVAPPARRRDASFKGALSFDRVSFRYAGRDRGLADVTFEVRPGEHVALAGPTGSGKTTVLRLALRLFDPASGAITLDGVDLRELDPSELRRLFAVVPQDVLLFDRTLAENIAFGSPGAGRERVDDAARLVGLDELAARLPRGLDTALGTRAHALSAGERQRIALARAIVRDAPILLLDEATSALDAETEREIAGVLARHARGRAMVTVSHRVARLRAAARILVLEDGRVVEQGTHGELLARDGVYRRLFEVGERSAP